MMFKCAMRFTRRLCKIAEQLVRAGKRRRANLLSDNALHIRKLL